MFETAIGMGLFGTAMVAQPTSSNQVFTCDGWIGDSHYVASIVETDLPQEQVSAAWASLLSGRGAKGGCSVRSNLGAAEKNLAEFARLYPNVKHERLEFEPTNPRPKTEKMASVTSRRKTETIFFREAQASSGENGYAGVTFDVEYQFLACSGELHIAYSLVEDSVGIGRLVGGGHRLVASDRSGRATYWHEGKAHKVETLPRTIQNVPLKGTVWMRFQDTPIGRFADDHAGKALGFGCFSGQTKKVADLKDLKADGKEPTKEELAKLFDGLRVEFKTVQMLTSSAAEQEIRSGLAQKAADDNERSGQAGLDAATEDRARRKAEREAEFAAKQAKYEQELAAQQKAVADFEAAQKQWAADQAAAGARAKAEQEEYARQRATYEAEVERIRLLNEANQAASAVGQEPQ